MDDEIRASAGIQRNMHGVHGCGYIPLCVHIEYMYTHVHTYSCSTTSTKLVLRASVRRSDQKLKKHPTAKLPGYPDTGVIIEPQQMRRMDALLKKLDTSCAARLAKNIERLKTAQNGYSCVRNGSVMPRKAGFAKQTQVMLLVGWSADDVA